MRVKEKIMFLLAMGFSSFFLAFASVYAVIGRLELVFTGSLLSWWGYLISHKISEGTFVDGKDERSSGKSMIPRDLERWAGIVAGSGTLIGGMVLGVKGLREERLILTVPAAVVFMSGYIVAHYSATGELL